MARRRVVAVWLAFVVLSVGVFAQTDKKTDDAVKKEAQALSKLTDAALAAQVGPNDFNVTWVRDDFLKGPKDKEFVPFTITLDPTKAPAENLTLYWRVVPSGGAVPASVDPTKKNDKQPASKPIWEGVTALPVPGPTNPMRLSPSFFAPEGNHYVYALASA